MATLTQVESKDPATVPADLPDVQDILVDYDEIKNAVTVTPDTVAKRNVRSLQVPLTGNLPLCFSLLREMNPTTSNAFSRSRMVACMKVRNPDRYRRAPAYHRRVSNDGGVIIVSPTRP